MKTPPDILDSVEPFVIPEHEAVETGTFHEQLCYFVKLEIVTKLKRHIIFRRRFAPEGKLSLAIRPPEAEGEKDGDPGPIDVCDKVSALLCEADAHDLARIVRAALVRLESKARSGDGEAVWRYADCAARATQALNDMVKMYPAAFRPIAGEMMAWPLMRSTHKKISDSDGILNDIGLGSNLKELLLENSENPSWYLDSLGACARRLFKHVDRERNRSAAFREYLPEYGQRSFNRWWNVAWKLFERSYPTPGEVAELRALITAKSKLTSPGRTKSQLKKKLHTRFFAMLKWKPPPIS